MKRLLSWKCITSMDYLILLESLIVPGATLRLDETLRFKFVTTLTKRDYVTCIVYCSPKRIYREFKLTRIKKENEQHNDKKQNKSEIIKTHEPMWSVESHSTDKDYVVFQRVFCSQYSTRDVVFFFNVAVTISICDNGAVDNIISHCTSHVLSYSFNRLLKFVLL